MLQKGHNWLIDHFLQKRYTIANYGHLPPL